jgi:hypothetical protein
MIPFPRFTKETIDHEDVCPTTPIISHDAPTFLFDIFSYVNLHYPKKI